MALPVIAETGPSGRPAEVAQALSPAAFDFAAYPARALTSHIKHK
jgi:hypothetical protein